MSEFDRMVWNLRERPLSPDNNQQATNAELPLRAVLAALTAPRVSATDATSQTPTPSGFFGEGFRCYAPTNSPDFNQITIAPGLGFWGGAVDPQGSIGGLSGVDDLATFKPLVLSATETITIAPNTSNPLTRVDLIEVRYRRELDAPTLRDVLDPVKGTFANAAVNKALSWDLAGLQGTVTAPEDSTAYISYKVGTDPFIPPVPTIGYVPLAALQIAAGAVGILSSSLMDRRRVLTPYGVQTVALVITVPDPTATAAAILTEFDGPPGHRTPTINSFAVSNGSLQIIIRLDSIPLAIASDPNRVSYKAEILGASPTAYPHVVGRVLQAGLSLDSPSIVLRLRAIILQTAGALLNTTLGTHATPTVFRVTITYW